MGVMARYAWSVRAHARCLSLSPSLFERPRARAFVHGGLFLRGAAELFGTRPMRGNAADFGVAKEGRDRYTDVTDSRGRERQRACWAARVAAVPLALRRIIMWGCDGDVTGT